MGRSSKGSTLTFHARYLPLMYGACVLSGFLACMFISYFYHFEHVTKTHCRLPEYFMTISAAIGDMFPEKSIFRYVMALTSGPRLLTCAIVYHLTREEIISGGPALSRWGGINTICGWLDFLKIFSAGIWIYVGSGENHDVHDVGFVSYVVFSVLHSIFHLAMFHRLKLKGRAHPHPEDVSSYKWKFFFSVGHVFWFLASMYYFVQHRFWCAEYGK